MSIPSNISPLGWQAALPAGYTPLEFLQSSGTQYIDTGLPINNGSALTVTCEINPNSGVTSGAIFGAQNTGVTQDRAGWSEFTKDNQGWVFWGWVSEFATLPTTPIERHRVELSQSGLYYNGEKVRTLSSEADFQTSRTCWLFARNTNATAAKYHGKIFSFTFAQNGKQMLDFIPCVNGKGEPCMFDTVSSKPFTNEGPDKFIAGVSSVGQLSSLLRNLPATGGELTLSLPAEANTPEVAEQLQACHDTKGWTLTVHEYRPATAATYSLRRVRSVVWCRVAACVHGSYANVHGVRFNIERCAAIFGEHGQDPTDYGYEPFDSVEQAAEQWNLTPYIAPEEEQP